MTNTNFFRSSISIQFKIFWNIKLNEFINTVAGIFCPTKRHH